MENIHRFRNNQKAIPIGNQGWDKSQEQHLIDLKVRVTPDGRYRDLETGHEFVNLCSCGYLGLQNHPAVLDGAIEALQSERVINTPLSRVRMRLSILDELEAELSDLYRARAITTLSASAAISGVLPLIASGHLADGQPHVMVFDKFCHFSMNHMKPICADESLVLTSPHNDLDYLEDVCRKHPRVAYVADGVYSTGGGAPIKGLLELQDRYGLFLFFDDSHSLAYWGERGEGFVRTRIPEMNPRTVVVCSLNKGFGGSGGVVMVDNEEQVTVLTRFGGPMLWSQHLPVASIGADLASARLQKTPELAFRQKRLRENVALFDSLIDTEEKGDGFAIRLIRIGSEEGAVEGSKEMMERGFYTSAVFFPIVERGRAGLRIMLRADHDPADVLAFCEAVREVREGVLVR
ncbi:MAG TPA: aminotransferase class I/II-fold pyridoxal phosphate-dependent enzyme [Thermoanaerobaculia bacterium]|nr:aminotransferase class I/II-fold pyridoxal phosphate-dependent enzyme [Thermoanaerobaculia bacterium]